MRNTTGYFFVASKFGGLISQYCTCAFVAPVTVRLSGVENATSPSHFSFSRVSGLASPPARETRYTSGGALIELREKIAKLGPTSNAPMAPPLVTTRGAPDGYATE